MGMFALYRIILACFLAAGMAGGVVACTGPSSTWLIFPKKSRANSSDTMSFQQRLKRYGRRTFGSDPMELAPQMRPA
jgi:hypothetical protein